MADITLVNLNMLYIKYLDGNVHRQCHLPLGPLYLVSALRGAGIEVDFRDYQLQEAEELFSPLELCNFIENPAPLLGLSCMSNLLPFVLYALPEIKKRHPEIIVILGGIGPAAIEKEIMECTPEVDIIFRGEADQAIAPLVKALKQGEPFETLTGIYYRRNGEIIFTGTAPRLQDLDALPFPAYDDLNFKKYIGHNILGSRGCPYPCTFCSIAPVWQNKACLRSLPNIIQEMKQMHHEHGVKQFLFQDEFFVSDPVRSLEFARLLDQARLDITYKVFARVDLVNADSIRALADTGCVEMRFGIESGSDKVLKLTRKGFSSEKAVKVVTEAKKIVRSVDAFYVWGFPFETMEDFSASLMQMIILRGQGVKILPSLLTYLPQTQIYRDLTNNNFEFCAYLLPEYMISGIERRGSVRVTIDDKYQTLFQYISSHRNLFPGFFHVDLEQNIYPKLELLEEFEFYTKDESEEKSCGAHSPSHDDNRLLPAITAPGC